MTETLESSGKAWSLNNRAEFPWPCLEGKELASMSRVCLEQPASRLSALRGESEAEGDENQPQRNSSFRPCGALPSSCWGTQFPLGNCPSIRGHPRSAKANVFDSQADSSIRSAGDLVHPTHTSAAVMAHG